jgi:succinate dehydrogenase / fumarate reductase, iron-sulfur subunit
MRVRFHIQRYDPESDLKPEMRAYGIDIGRGTSILDGLAKIKSEIDGSLTYRASCRTAICGSCPMMINGMQRLACRTPIFDEYERVGSIEIRPMANMRVIKDLAVDMEPFWEKVHAVTPWLQAHDDPRAGEAVILQDAIEGFHNTDACILCGACVSACNSLEISRGFLGPAALAKAYRFIADPRDEAKSERLSALIEPDGIWDCVRCNYCVEVCPKDVAPMEAIVGHGMGDSIGGRHSTAVTEIVKKEGRLNEGMLPLKMIAGDPGKLLGVMPLAVKLFFRGKAPFPWHWPIRGIRSVRRLFTQRGF